jgi:hypothetical protein
VQGGQVPNPFRPVAHHHPEEGAAPAPFPGFLIKALSELLGGFDGAGIGGGIGSADRVAILVPRGLGEDAPQLDFPGMRRLALDLTLPTHRLFLHHRDSRPIHLHVEDGNRLPRDDRKVQRPHFRDFPLLALSDIGADPLRCALHRFGGHLQAGQNFHLFPPVIEGGLLAHESLHAAHSRREFRVLDVQFHIGGKLTGVTVRAPVAGTGDFHRAHGGQHGLGTQLPVVSLAATATRKGAPVGGGSGETQEFGQGGGSGPMQGRAHRHLHRLQVDPPALALITEDHPQQALYFLRDFMMDRIRCFFSARERFPSSSKCRCWQMASLTSTSCALNC